MPGNTTPNTEQTEQKNRPLELHVQHDRSDPTGQLASIFLGEDTFQFSILKTEQSNSLFPSNSDRIRYLVSLLVEALKACGTGDQFVYTTPRDNQLVLDNDKLVTSNTNVNYGSCYLLFRANNFPGKYKAWPVMSMDEKAFHLIETIIIGISYLLRSEGGSSETYAQQTHQEFIRRLEVVRKKFAFTSLTNPSEHHKKSGSEEKQNTKTTYLALPIAEQIDDLIVRMQLPPNSIWSDLDKPWAHQIIQIIEVHTCYYDSQNLGKKLSPIFTIMLYWDSRILGNKLSPIFSIALNNSAKVTNNDHEQKAIIVDMMQQLGAALTVTPDIFGYYDVSKKTLFEAITTAIAAMKEGKIGINLRDQQNKLMKYDDEGPFGQTFKCLNDFLEQHNPLKFDDNEELEVVNQTLSQEFIIVFESEFCKRGVNLIEDYFDFSPRSDSREVSQEVTLLRNILAQQIQCATCAIEQLQKTISAINKFFIKIAPSGYGDLKKELKRALVAALPRLPNSMSVLETKSDQLESKQAPLRFNPHNAVTDLIAQLTVMIEDGKASFYQRVKPYGVQVLELLDAKLDYAPTRSFSAALSSTWTNFSMFSKQDKNTKEDKESKQPATRNVDTLYQSLKDHVKAKKQELVDEQKYLTLESQVTELGNVAQYMLDTLNRLHDARDWEEQTLSYRAVSKTYRVKHQGSTETSVLNAAKTVQNAIKEGKMGINPRDKNGVLLKPHGKDHKDLLVQLIDFFLNVENQNQFKLDDNDIEEEYKSTTKPGPDYAMAPM